MVGENGWHYKPNVCQRAASLLLCFMQVFQPVKGQKDSATLTLRSLCMGALVPLLQPQGLHARPPELLLISRIVRDRAGVQEWAPKVVRCCLQRPVLANVKSLDQQQHFRLCAHLPTSCLLTGGGSGRCFSSLLPTLAPHVYTHVRTTRRLKAQTAALLSKNYSTKVGQQASL